MSGRANPGNRSAGNKSGAVKAALITGGCAVLAAIITASVTLISNHSGHAPAPSSSTPGSTPAAGGTYRAVAGPSCNQGVTFTTDGPSGSGGWASLPGSATGGCGNALTHQTTGQAAGANWDFAPGVGATCTFQIYIPRSNEITTTDAIYQAWDTLTGQHTDGHRISPDSDQTENQEGNRGGVITLQFGPTKSGTMDLQLYDGNADNTYEVAGMVKATCD